MSADPVFPASPGAAAPSTAGTGTGDLLQVMRDGRPRTRAELVELTGLARSTVKARVDALLATGLLAPAGAQASTGGRPPTRFAFNPGCGLVLASDVGATHARAALTDLDAEVLVERSAELDVAAGPDVVLDWLVRTGHELLKDAGRSVGEVVGVGIGLPGPVEHDSGRPVNPPIMPGWDGFDVPGYVSERLAGPVLVDNDVNIMALGEHTVAYPAVEHLVFVKVATGIGAGIISGGRLHRGAQGAAGDLGHVLAPHAGDVPCRCGNTGCLEAIASGAAVAAALREQGLDVAGSRDVVRLARAGDVPTIQALRQAGRDLGEVLATVVSMLNPSVIALGGVLPTASESLVAGVREVVYGRSLPLATGSLQIVASRTGEHAAVTGAAAMVVQHVLAPEQVDAALANGGTRTG